MDHYSLGHMDSEPHGSCVLEHGHELAGEVQGHDPIHIPDEFATDEDGGDGRRASEAAGELSLHLASPGVLVELVHRRAHAEVGEKANHGVAHRALARREDHYRLLRRQLRQPVRHHRRLGLEMDRASG